jgi:hypothetical protein
MTSPKFPMVRMMLGLDPADAVHEHARWARWMRLGCPTTSNAAESVHAKLNARVHTARTFLERLGIVKELLFIRYEERNSPDRVHRRSANRLKRMMSGKERMPLADDPGNRVFLSRRNSRSGALGPRENWLFQQSDAPRFPLPLNS